MTVFFTEHARERARERYGLELSSNDMREIIRATKDGRAQMMKRSVDEGSIIGDLFIWTYKGRMVLPVVTPQGVIVTFQPPDYFLKSTRHQFKGLDGRRGITPRRGQHINGRPSSRRPKSNRQRFAEEK